MKRTASARWQGGLKDGKGGISTQSGVLADTPYSFGARFEQATGTNPEELIAAAHAGCFTMALSAQLDKAGLKADSLQTNCTVTMEKRETGWEVTESHLDLTATIPGADVERFEAAANEAKANCPISRLLNTMITMDARLATTA
jgi:lipoyl-dependent peroxiredoxin